MTDQTLQVRPGDLITAQLFNALIMRLAEIEDLVGDGGAGLLEVPRLVGLTLGQGEDLLNQSGSGFTVGDVIDAFGATLNPTVATVRARRVLNQVPPPGLRVSAASAIDLVVAAATSGGTAPTVRVPTLTGFSPNPVPADTPLTILGTNFGTPPSPLVVTIDGLPAQILPLSRQDTSVTVTLPTFPAPAPTAGRPIVVSLTAQGGSVSSDTVPAASRPRLVPATGTRPEITRILDATGAAVAPGGAVVLEGQYVIEGENFAAGAGNSLVVTISQNEQIFQLTGTGSTRRLTLTIPEVGNLTDTNPAVTGTIMIQVNEQTNRSDPFALTFVLPTN